MYLTAKPNSLAQISHDAGGYPLVMPVSLRVCCCVI